MCWWEMTMSSRSSTRCPCAASAHLERVERRAGVRPGVEQRQRVVLDEVRVDRADLKRRRDRQAVDAGVGGPRERRVAPPSLTSG